jgi:hypothetical protein
MKAINLTFATAIIMVCLFSNSFAQNGNDENEESGKKSNVWFGIRGGTDLATPTLDTEEIKSQLNSNYQFGVFVRIGKNLFIQPEVYYAVKNEYNTYPELLLEEKVMVNYLKVPVMLGFRVIDLGIVSAHLMAGPQGSMFLNQSVSEHQVERPKYEYKLQLGGGVEVLNFICLDVRYSTNLNRDTMEEIKQISLRDGVNVTLGIKFR